MIISQKHLDSVPWYLRLVAIMSATVEGTDQSATAKYDQIQREKAKTKGPKNKELRNFEQQLFKSQANLSAEEKLEVYFHLLTHTYYEPY